MMTSIHIRHAVVIAGGGPTGLMLAGELALAGVDVAIVERRPDLTLTGARAGGLHARTIEVMDQRGLAHRFLAEGTVHQTGFTFRHVPIDISTLPSRHNYYIGLWQKQIERILAGWVDELGVPVYRGREVTTFQQDDGCVRIELSDGTSTEAEYLVGCDGGRSIIRKTAGIDFAGWDATKSWLIAEVQVTEEPAWGFREDATGIHAIGKLQDDRAMRVVLTEPGLKIGGEPTLSDLRETLVGVYGTDFGAHTPSSISRFTDVSRQAAAYRDRRVLLAGDAAHVHPPMGGQGLNIGVQDAVNLGWKLAQVVKGASSPDLLDTYQAERHPIAARVLRTTMAHVALQRPDERSKALGEVVAELLASEETRRQLAIENAGLGIHYGQPQCHPLVGRRMPNLDITTAAGPERIFTLLHQARPVLVNFSESACFDVSPWADRLKQVNAVSDGPLQLPLMGEIPVPAAVLIRPDGYVAWASEGGDRGLVEALTQWFGSPAPVNGSFTMPSEDGKKAEQTPAMGNIQT